MNRRSDSSITNFVSVSKLTRPSKWAVRHWREASEGALFLAFALVVLWPVSLHLGDRIVGTGDGQFYLWLGWRMSEIIHSGSFPTSIPDATYPTAYNVTLGDGYGAYLLIALWNLVANPYLAINLTVITALALNFLAGRRLGRIVAPERRLVWALTALAFASAPSILLRAYGHFHLLFSFVSALVLAEAVLYVRDGRALRFMRVALLLALAFLLSIYWFATSVAMLVAVVAVSAFRRRELASAVIRVGGAVLIALALMTPLIVPRVAFTHREQAASHGSNLQAIDNENNSILFSADALSVVAQPSASRIPLPGASRLHRNFYPNRLESTIYPGLLLVAAFLVFVFLRSPLRLPITVAAFVVWLLALGPTLTFDGRALFTHADGSPLRFMPEQLLYSLPGTSALRTPDRLACGLPALCAVAFALVAARVLGSLAGRWHVALAAAGAVALIATNLVVLPYTTRSLPPGLQAALERIRSGSRPHDTVMEVPFDAAGQFVQTISFQMIYKRPALGFHAQHSALPWYSGFDRYKRSTALAELRCFPPLIGYAPAPYERSLRPTGRELAGLRREFRVKFLIVNQQLLDTPLCNDRRQDIESILHGAHLIYRGPDWRILELS